MTQLKDIFFFKVVSRNVLYIMVKEQRSGKWKCLEENYVEDEESSKALFDEPSIRRYISQGDWKIVDDYLPPKFDFLCTELYTATLNDNGRYDVYNNNTHYMMSDFAVSDIRSSVKKNSYVITNIYRGVRPEFDLVEELNKVLAKEPDDNKKLDALHSISSAILTKRALIDDIAALTSRLAENQRALDNL